MGFRIICIVPLDSTKDPHNFPAGHREKAAVTTLTERRRSNSSSDATRTGHPGKNEPR